MGNDALFADKHALQSLQAKLTVVRDLVTAVIMFFKTGLFLYGPGGIGKSYTVLSLLNALEANYLLHNSRMTGKGLFLALKNAPDAIHVLEDMERITQDRDAQGVLRSALWAQPGHDRVVTWTTATDGPQRFAFRGGLILISNRPLADLPELRAMATRIEVHHLEVSEAEMVALMRDLATQGYRHGDTLMISPEECTEVTEHLIRECKAAGCPLDLRLQQKAFQTYLQWEAEWSSCHWKDLVATSVRETSYHLRFEPNDQPRDTRKAERRNILRAIIAKTKDTAKQMKEYLDRTQKSRADFFRRKREVETGEFDEEDVA